MAVAIDPTPLINDARCSFQCIPPGMVWYCVLAAILDVGNGATVPTDTNELLSEATCLEHCIPQGFLPYAILGAITNLTSGGGLGVTQVYTGAAPPAAPDDPTKPALYYPTGLGTMLQWDTVGLAWG